MTALRPTVLALGVLASAAGAAPAAASAAPAFRDRVLGAHDAATARAAGADGTPYRTADGYTIHVSVQAGYAAGRAAAPGYVAFLDGLPHGPELGRLNVRIVRPGEVDAACGGVDGTLACYVPATRTMTVPGEPRTATDGVTTDFVIAHEYGHHIAAFRDNAPFRALDVGPKYWSSYELVCARALAHPPQLAPGAEGVHYLQNPGEAWADTYARLVYPDVPWTFTPVLEPDAGALAAARRDVVAPWRHPRHRRFHGVLRRRGPQRRTFAVRLHLDGALTVRLHGPRGANDDLAIRADGHRQGRTRDPGSRDVLRFRHGACRTRPVERIRVRVLRRSGAGPFSVTVRYAG